MSSRYEKSESHLKRALEIIPLGAQTFSKSMTQYPYGVSPYFASHGEGAHIFDIDGNEYVDFINGLASVTLGYKDPDVNAAVQKQLEEGPTFSLSHPIEAAVAEKLIEIIPCAEMVRFGKNGSDVTTGAIRIARAYTNRDYVAVCGYHGWQDWYIGSTSKDLGVPNAVKDLTLTFEYNDINSLKKLFSDYPGKISAVILEPMGSVQPDKGFLEKVKEETHKNDAILIFDEMVTGFRFANGGAQEYFNVEPDLATFGKGLANGFPLSAIVGKKKYMNLMKDIFFSFTFGGETMSLAAALATIEKYQKEPVIQKLEENGNCVIDTVSELIKRYSLEHIFSVTGHPSWSFLNIKDTDDYSNYEIKTFYMQEMFKNGILIYGTHNISYAHNKKDLEELFYAYEEMFKKLSSVLKSKTLIQNLDCEPLKPLFKVRA